MNRTGAPLRTPGGGFASSVTAYPLLPAAASSADVKPVEDGHDEASERVPKAEMRDSIHCAESGSPLGIE
jgi:hypothetical protein